MIDPGSFRDPSGLVFRQDGVLYRKINPVYQNQYESLMTSGLYNCLVGQGLLVSHREIEKKSSEKGTIRIIQPDTVPFVSYPYEWSFGEYKDAALTTLIIQKEALNYGMILKDASAYNIQFLMGKPVFIDTLSFDFYGEGTPWVAYGQFCRHFLAPLLLMAEVDVRLSQMMRNYIDGIPLDLASRLLRLKRSFTAIQHIHLHAKMSERHADDGLSDKAKKVPFMSKFQLSAMIEGLIRSVKKIRLKGIRTEWGDYYSRTNYSDEAAGSKLQIVSELLSEVQPGLVWDFGANDGRYSKKAAELGAAVVAFDIDPVAVERNYNDVKLSSGYNMLPLVLDLTNPSPGIGFGCRERNSINDREKPDCIMALALIHHLAISNNLPFAKIAEWFSGLSRNLIIEFVPKEDSQVQIMLSSRTDIFPDYTRETFEKMFCRYYSLQSVSPIQDSERLLYLFKIKE